MSKWAAPIIKKEIIFSQTSLCQKVFLWVSGASVGGGIYENTGKLFTTPYYSVGSWIATWLTSISRRKICFLSLWIR